MYCCWAKVINRYCEKIRYKVRRIDKDILELEADIAETLPATDENYPYLESEYYNTGGRRRLCTPTPAKLSYMFKLKDEA